jgi:hypothetical protein
LHIITAFRPNEVRRSDYSQAAKWPILSSGFASQEQVVRGSRERDDGNRQRIASAGRERQSAERGSRRRQGERAIVVAE